MEQLFVSPYLLAVIFFVVSTAYSAVGLGGGTAYTALLAIFGASHRAIPTVSLTMNVVVTLVASFNFIRAGHARLSLIIPFILSSIPMAYVGGSLDVEARTFHLILIALLALVAARIYLWRHPSFDLNLTGPSRVLICLAIGAVLGLVSGIVGIGGGIFLVPLIILLGLADQRQAAVAGALFVLLNSLSGLSAHLQRHAPDLMDIAPLVAAVIAGGFLGSYLSSTRLDRSTIQRILGAIIVIAVVLLIIRL